MEKILALITSIIMTIMSLLFPGIKEDNSKWMLKDVPVYYAGDLCETLYNAGCGLENDWDTGTSEKDSMMQLVSSTNLKDYQKYCKTLLKNGYTQVYSNTEYDTYSTSFSKGEKMLYTYYSDRRGETRIIEESCAQTPITDFGYTYSEGASSDVYQFSYPYFDKAVHNNSDIYSKNGMMYIIKLADNKLMVVDAGSALQATDTNIEECMKLMRKITNTPEGEKVNIALWFGTHAHGDHATFFHQLLGAHKKDINVERVMFNYLSYSHIAYSTGNIKLKKRLVKYYPEVKYLKPHTGMNFNLANIGIDVLYTHEDSIDARTGVFPATNINDTMVVLKITIAGKTLLLLGDSGSIVEKNLLDMYNPNELNANVLQAAHHMYNDLTQLYAVMKPDYIFVPQSELRSINEEPAYQTLLKVADKDRFLFADKGLYCINFSPEGLTVSFSESKCIPYDGT